MTGLETVGGQEEMIPPPQDDSELTDMQIIESADKNSEEADEDEIRQFLITHLKPLVDDYINDEVYARNTAVKTARRNDNYWRNFQDLWWDDVSQNWMPLSQSPDGWEQDDFADSNVSDRFINIYKAHGESIIAALSNGVPATKFFPEDADNPDDVATAQAFTKLAGYLRKNNKARITLIKALVTLYNEPFVAIYNYTDRNKRYGTVREEVTGLMSNNRTQLTCPDCGSVLDETVDEPTVVEEGYTPSTQLGQHDEAVYCENCDDFKYPFTESNEDLTEGVVDYKEKEKVRVIQEVYGVLNVGFAAYAKEQKDIPCLWLDNEMSVALAKTLFPDIADEITATTTENDLTENRWARTNQDYRDSLPQYTCTVRYAWVREWAFNRVEDTEARERLFKMFPDGVKVSLVNNDIAEVEPQNLDDHWTISNNPLFRHLSGDAIGTALIPIQDVKNEVFRLSVDTIEHGISETFVEADILDLQNYAKEEIRPGTLTPVKSNGQKSIGESFFQNKPANLSGELDIFNQGLEKDGQFVSGAFPSIYGGSVQGLGETLGAYQESRNQALQRLQLIWHLICNVWSEMEYKSIYNYVSDVDYDIKNVVASGTGYMNEWVRQAQLKGKASCIEPEANEAFPVSWAQKKAVLEQFLQLNNEYINTIMGDPNNVGKIAQVFGMSDLFIPGEADRNKQLWEIGELLKSAPTEQPASMDPMTGQMIPAKMIPSVMPEVEVDDNEIHIATCKAWCVSEAGMAARQNQPEGYLNVLAHMKMTEDMAMQYMAQQQMKMQSMMPQPAAGSEDIQGPPPPQGAQ